MPLRSQVRNEVVSKETTTTEGDVEVWLPRPLKEENLVLSLDSSWK